LYDDLLRVGVRIFEYCERPFHGKVALVDREWATVGSSNLDPLSLALNLEANIVVRDRGFNAQLYDRLAKLMASQCTEIDASTAPRARFWRPVASFLAFHFIHHFHVWASWLPAHRPRLSTPPESRHIWKRT
jgi:cardiolipin synthase